MSERKILQIEFVLLSRIYVHEQILFYDPQHIYDTFMSFPYDKK